MRYWILALVVAGAGCDRVLGLDERASIDAPIIDAAIDAPDDEDLDGILVGDDNCPTIANADQLDGDDDGHGDVCDTCPQLAEPIGHDEDGDRIGDRCDNCPHVAGASQANADGDDLGDLCDDRPAIDCIARFDPFVTLPTAERTTGTWQVLNGELRQTDPEVVHAIFVFDAPILTSPWLVTSARMVSRAADPTQQLQIGAWAAIHNGGAAIGLPAGIVTEILSSPTSNGSQLYTSTVQPSGSAATLQASTIGPTGLVIGSDVSIHLRIPTPTSYDSLGAVGPNVVSHSGIVSPPEPAGRVGLRTVYTGAAFTYLLVIEAVAAGPCPPR